MRHPERRQEDEGKEAHIRRISKFPTISYGTLKCFFWSEQKHSKNIFEDWIKQAFPKSDWSSYEEPTWDELTSTDLDYLNNLHPARIPTKEFAQWIAEENIFDAWRGLGEEPSPLAELFIELVLAKDIDRKKSSKSSRKKSHPSTDRGRLDFFKSDEFIPLVELVLKENPDWQNHQVLANKKVEDALDMCGFPKGTPSNASIKKWIGIARKNVGAKAKIGRPSK